MKEWTREREDEQMTDLSKVAAAKKERNERMSLLSKQVGATRATRWWARQYKESE